MLERSPFGKYAERSSFRWDASQVVDVGRKFSTKAKCYSERNDMKKAVVLFSGGVDSTYLVAKIAQDYDWLILLTYKVPGMINVNFSSRSFEQLQRILGNKLEHRIIDIREFINLKRGGVGQCLKDNVRYKFFYSWCMGCKVAMHLYTIQFCHDNSIDCVLDGSNYYDIHALEQHKDAKDLFASIYQTHGVTILAPYYYDEAVPVLNQNKVISFLRFTGLYKDSTESRVRYLETLGIKIGKGFFSQYRKTQPSCLTSLFFNGVRLLLKGFFKEKSDCSARKQDYLDYISDKFDKGSTRYV
jgi:hypothetical protein